MERAYLEFVGASRGIIILWDGSLLHSLEVVKRIFSISVSFAFKGDVVGWVFGLSVPRVGRPFGKRWVGCLACVALVCV